MSTEPAGAAWMSFRSHVGRAVTTFLFPSACLVCAEPLEEIRAGGVCRACWECLPALAPRRCFRCDEPLPAMDAEVCGRCLLDPPPFAGLRAAAPYRGTARAILIAFKFRSADFLAGHLARRMANALERGVFDEVVPVPATAISRLRRDHAADLLGAALARRLGRPFSARRLRKVRATERQSGLRADRRAGNVRGAFRAQGRPAPRVLLVDDVATSGSTARECSRALLAAGARSVRVAVFARATRDDEIAAARDEFREGIEAS
ncbi:MAG: ComF family protein [Acidobacteriota bacterium]